MHPEMEVENKTEARDIVLPPSALTISIYLNFRYILHSAAQFLPPHMSSGDGRKVLDSNPPNDEDGSCRLAGTKGAYCSARKSFPKIICSSPVLRVERRIERCYF